MNSELKQEYTRRITSANKSELIVIMFEMYHQYSVDAIVACDEERYSDMHLEIRRARSVVSALIGALDMSYELSANLYGIYRFVERDIISADIKRNKDGLEEALRLMDKLMESFREMAKADVDAPMIQNAEAIYAGMTYGRGSVMEMSNAGSNRGFFA